MRYKEQDLPTAKHMRKTSRESDSAYDSVVHNIIVGLKKSKRYSYEYPVELPMIFKGRLKKWLECFGYKVRFVNTEKNFVHINERQSTCTEEMRVIISWD